uniref:Unannotated protein n=1 Tax=freshwater metagenome TaxID=449393 RepID=A0A6J5ZJF4_9ZZZZ
MFHHDARHVGRRHVGTGEAVGVDLALATLALVLLLLEQQLTDMLRAHAATEVLAKAVRRAEAALQFTEESLVGDQLLRLEFVLLLRTVDVGAERPLAAFFRRIFRRLNTVCEQLPDLAQSHPLVVVVGLGVVDVGGQRLADVGNLLLALILGKLLDVDLEPL